MIGGRRCEENDEGKRLLGDTKRPSISVSSVHPNTGEGRRAWGFSKKQWFLFFMFSVADLLAGILYSLQGPFYPEEAEKKGATASQYGLVFGVFQLSMFIVSPIYGKYMSKLGPRNVFNVSIFVTGTCCILFGLLDKIDDKWTFISMSFLIRIVEGAGNAGFTTAAYTIIAMEFPDCVATTFASLETFFGFGLIVGPTVGGALYQLGGYPLPFLVTGGMVLTTAVVIAVFMPKRESDGLLEDARGYGLLTVLKIPGVMLSATAIFTGAIAIGFLGSVLEPHIRQFNLSPVIMGSVYMINGGVYAVTAPFWGILCDKIKQTKFITLTGATFLVIGFILVGPAPFLPFDTVLWVTCLGLVFVGLGVGATFVSAFILGLRHSIASGLPDNVATSSVVAGLWNSVLALGLFIGPSAAGVLFDTVGFRWGSMMVVGEAGMLIIAICFFVFCNAEKEELYFKAWSTSSRSINSKAPSDYEAITNNPPLTISREN